MNNQLNRLRAKLLDMLQAIDNGDYDKEFEDYMGDGEKLCSFSAMVEDIPGEPPRRYFLCPDNVDDIIAQRKALADLFPSV